MLVFPPIKINLGLNITEKRKDGYHSIESVFFPVPWTDVLEAVITENHVVTFNSSGLNIPGNPSNNLVIKAYELLSAKYDLPGMDFHLHKILPMGAGLGGGSSDGAYALKLINDLCGLGLTLEELETDASNLGSDCPFFIQSTPKFVSGRGELLEPVSIDLKDWYILIVMPDISVGTAAAYSWITPSAPRMPVRKIVEQSPEHWKDILVNDFEAPVIQRYPIIGEIKNKMYEQGATYASMSGSGAAVYGLFRSMPVRSFWSIYQHWSGILK